MRRYPDRSQCVCPVNLELSSFVPPIGRSAPHWALAERRGYFAGAFEEGQGMIGTELTLFFGDPSISLSL